MATYLSLVLAQFVAKNNFDVHEWFDSQEFLRARMQTSSHYAIAHILQNSLKVLQPPKDRSNTPREQMISIIFYDTQK